MAEPFIGEIRAFGFNFAPYGWAFCEGQLTAISQAEALFAIIGTFYGGNGTNNFALPNLKDRAVMSQGRGPGLTSRNVGQPVGEMSVVLAGSQIPAHTHSIASANASVPTQKLSGPTSNAFIGGSNPGRAYVSDTTVADVALSPKGISDTGGSQSHENMQPILALNFCIALVGIFPSRN